jgi:probable phosphoglycerate mutase
VDDATKTTRLVLVRHGEANAAVERIVGGHRGCTGLSDLGRSQAERLRDRLAGIGFEADAIVASVLPRAVETGEIVSAGIGYDAARIEQRCGLCEIHPGEADGLPWDVVQQRYQGEPSAGGEVERPLSPGGETFTEFSHRVLDALDRLVDDFRGQTVLVACHGGVITAATLGFLGLGFRWFSETIVNTSLTEWVHQDDVWRLSRFNDAAHLE